MPPSETKAAGGLGPPLDLAALSFPELGPVRGRLVDTLVELAADPPAARRALGLSERQDDEIARNAQLRTSPTTPALHRYTGVLYDALDAGSLTRAQRAGAGRRLIVASALFGFLRADDPVPAYRLSAGSALPGVPALGALWRPALAQVLGRTAELVVDLRSGSYAALGPDPGAVSVRVVSERDDGTRAVVSHVNKAHKGRLARLLVSTTAEPDDVRGLCRVLRRARMRVEQSGTTALTLVVPAAPLE